MLWSALVGGFAGTLVLTTVQRAGAELGFTRMDLSFLLGTMVTDHRRRAKIWGYAMHFAIGMAFAVAYGVFFAAIQQCGWRLGAMLGAVQALFSGTVLVTIILPIAHPRIGTPETAANEIALVEPPGFLFLNYGRGTFLVSLASHLAYGAIVGWAIRI